MLFHPICVVHFNPAITIACFCCRKIGWKETILYFLSQTIGGALGALFLWLASSAVVNYSHVAIVPSYALDVPEKANIASFLLSEAITSLGMCLTTLMVLYETSFKDKTGVLHIGMSVFLGIAAGSRIGAGCLNPLRSIALFSF